MQFSKAKTEDVHITKWACNLLPNENTKPALLFRIIAGPRQRIQPAHAGVASSLRLAAAGKEGNERRTENLVPDRPANSVNISL